MEGGPSGPRSSYWSFWIYAGTRLNGSKEISISTGWPSPSGELVAFAEGVAVFEATKSENKADIYLRGFLLGIFAPVVTH